MKYLSYLLLFIGLSIRSYTARADQNVDKAVHDKYREAKNLEWVAKYHADKELEHKTIKEEKEKEAVVVWWQYNEFNNSIILSTSATWYNTKREEHLYTKVSKTVDLPWFGDYQDLLASYAYNICEKVMADQVKEKNWWKYDCQTFVLVLNSENWGWDKEAKNNNSNWTRDWGLPQLNSQYHSDFINSERFLNPLSQLEYGLWVWKDASRKGVMPRYGYHPRFQRDKWIQFLK